MSQSAHSPSDTGSTAGPLRARLSITPHVGSGCPVVRTDRSIDKFTQNLKPQRTDASQDGGCGSDCGECHAEVTFGSDSGPKHRYVTSAVTARCICPVFEQHNCITEINAVSGDSVIMTVTVQSRDELRSIVTELQAVEARVSVERLVQGDRSAAITEIETGAITDKQEEALELAVASGYYEKPRGTDLGTIAAELDISESAASQRLNAAETKLVKAFLAD